MGVDVAVKIEHAGAWSCVSAPAANARPAKSVVGTSPGEGLRRWLAVGCAVVACTALPAGAAAADSSALKDVETITVLPIVFSKAFQVESRDELQFEIDKMLLRKLALKGYVLDRPRGWKAPDDWSAETLQALAPSALAALAPERARHVALLYVEQIAEAGNVVSSSAQATVSASILDTSAAVIVWRKSGTGEFAENALGTGIVTMMFTPDKYFALERAFGKLFDGFPERDER